MPELLAIVSTEFDDRVRCGQPNCGHSIYRRIHVVREEGQLLVLGSTCFAKRFGTADALGQARHGGGDGRKLTEAERQLLVENTTVLIDQFEQELVEAHARREKMRILVPAHVAQKAIRAPEEQPRPGRTLPAANKSPWIWMKPMTSMMYFQLCDGTGWV